MTLIPNKYPYFYCMTNSSAQGKCFKYNCFLPYLNSRFLSQCFFRTPHVVLYFTWYPWSLTYIFLFLASVPRIPYSSMSPQFEHVFWSLNFIDLELSSTHSFPYDATFPCRIFPHEFYLDCHILRKLFYVLHLSHILLSSHVLMNDLKLLTSTAVPL